MAHKESLHFHVKGNFRDLFAFVNLKANRQKKLQQGPNTQIDPPFINQYAQQLHPYRQYLRIENVRQETISTKTYRLVPDHTAGTSQLAYFRAGQYLSIKIMINGSEITRPFSIASSPLDATKGFYELTIKKVQGGFVSEYILNNWKVGDQVISSDPMGWMYYEPIRDSNKIIGIAGGSGITPFRSLARELCSRNLDYSLHILYGCSDGKDILYQEELQELCQKYPGKVQVTYIFSCADSPIPNCEHGFITADIMKKYSKPETDSYFICGPAVMYDFVEKELSKLNIPPKQIRFEAYGELHNVIQFPSYPKDLSDKNWTIRAYDRGQIWTFNAKATESVLVALERAQLVIPSGCRSGECQLCRTRLIKGQIWVSPKSDGRRMADKKFGFFHPCASFPLSDLEIDLP